MADLEQLVLSISADTRQMQRALARLTADTQQAADGVDKAFGTATPKIDNVAKSMGKTSAATSNLAAQFQDIAVQLQGGQSPFTVALQQGTQISAVLGQQGAGGAVGLLSGAFTSLLSPVALGTIAIIALGGAAVQYAVKAMGGIGDLDDRLKAHGELIKGLKDAYGEAGKGVDTAVKDSISVLKTLLSLSTESLQKELQNLSKSALSSTIPMAQAVDDFGRVLAEGTDKFAPFRSAIDDFNKSAAAGAPNVRGFREAVSNIVENSSDENVRKLGKALLEATEQTNKIELALDGAKKSLREFSAEALAAAEQGDKFAAAMKKLGSSVTPDLTDRQKIMENYNKALEAAGSTEERVAAARVKNDQLAILSANERKKAGEDASKEAESAQKRFDSALNSAARNSATAAGAAEAIGQGAGALAKLEVQSRLTETAQQSFGKVSEETAAKIKAQAEAAGTAADALAKAKVASQIDFAGKTAFLSDTDVRIAQQLSSIYGNDVKGALNSTYASAIMLNDALRAGASSLGNNLTNGLTDIASGAKSAKDGVAGMARSILRDIQQIIIKTAIVGPLMRSLQSGLGSILGGARATAGIGGLPAIFADGGYTGPGGKYTPKGIVHAGEVVWSQRDIARAGGVRAVEGMRLRGYADGGVVAMPSIPSVPHISPSKGGQTFAPVYHINAAGADSGTVARIEAVLAQHARTIQVQGRAMQSAQRAQATGVS